MPPSQSVDDGIPCLSKQSISVDFIEHHNLDFRDAQGELPCKYDPSRQQFVARPAAWHATLADNEEEWRQSKLRVVTTAESFSNALLTLKAKKTKDGKISSFDLDSCHGWEEVTELIQEVVEEYHNKDTVWAKIRGEFRRVGDNAGSIQSFVSLLPDGHYKTLCGGLTLILTVRYP